MAGYPCCCRAYDPCDLDGDPPPSLQVSTACGGLSPWSGTFLLPHKGLQADMQTACTSGRTLGAACYYYWSDDLGGNKFYVVGIGNPSAGCLAWAIDNAIGGLITSTIKGLWQGPVESVFTNWDILDTPGSWGNGGFPPCTGFMTVVSSP